MSDREKLIDWISDIIDFVDWEHIEEVADHLIANGVVIQKQAEWILVDKKKGNGVCSNCHRLDYIDSLDTYCRYCGSKMKEV